MKALLITTLIAATALTNTVHAEELHPATKTAIVCSAWAYNLSWEYKGINRYMENTYFTVSDKLLGAAGYNYDLEKAKAKLSQVSLHIHEQGYSIPELLEVFNYADNTALSMTCRDFYNSFSNDKLK
ncbi:hypothetical protein [Vibrio fluvialis]|uniref:hypothetical protein n=1 Tax=Vibrio fluvialis TaxID=676 RepID=UPI0028F6E1BE|nr:hypothetical protein [Vibrio fluvialis]